MADSACSEQKPLVIKSGTMKRLSLFLFCALLGGALLTQQAAEPHAPRSLMVPMRDGVRLATDVYLPPQAAPPFPVVLMRTPYGKSNTGGAGQTGTKLGY